MLCIGLNVSAEGKRKTKNTVMANESTPLKVAIFESTNEATAIQEPRKTDQGIAALIKILSPDNITEVQGNVVIDYTQIPLVRWNNEVWVWVKPGSKNITVFFENSPSVEVNFADFGIDVLSDKTTYYLIFTNNKTEKGGYGKLVCNSPAQIILIDGKNVKPDSNNNSTMTYDSIPSGYHTLELLHSGYRTLKYRVLVSSNEQTDLYYGISMVERGRVRRPIDSYIILDKLGYFKSRFPIETKHCTINEIGIMDLWYKKDPSDYNFYFFGNYKTEKKKTLTSSDCEELLPLIKEELNNILLPIEKELIPFYKELIKYNVKVNVNLQHPYYKLYSYSREEIEEILKQCYNKQTE